MKYRIKEHRKAKSWTLDRLAEEVGTSKGYLSDIERGNRTASVPMLRDIASALGVKEQELFAVETEQDEQLLQLMNDFMRLSHEDQAAVARHAHSLLPDDD
ncbi:helix-turn-helix transcriptional regulator [Paracoccus sp. (in: a-proteobacteria)]|uniref:helix-turn-helix domain-containing protein n=1 Tax=Paracoccus sp. TaxID=267 RepID=UPI0028A66753|nr:helix-turn-helix transcriptional regulator [Paracoccus sp. (in: a-proteobacteria)]